MNPILASTKEFNQYLQERLHSSNSASTNQKSKSTSKPSLPLSHSNDPALQSLDYSNIILNNALPEDSFLGTKPASISRPHTTGRASRKVESKQEEKVEIVHSWRKHLSTVTDTPPPISAIAPTPDHSRINVHIPLRPATANSKHPIRDLRIEGEEDELEPRSFKPLPTRRSPVSQTASSHYDSRIAGSKSSRYGDYDSNLVLDINRGDESIPAVNSPSTSLYSPLKSPNRRIELKLRVKVLQKCFHGWNGVIRETSRKNLRNALIIQEKVNDFRIRRVFRQWYNLYRAEDMIQMNLKRKMYLFFLILQKKLIARKRRKVQLLRFRYGYYGHQFFRSLRLLLKDKAKRDKKQSKNRKALIHRIKFMLATVFNRWKIFIKQELTEKKLMFEQYQRRSKIQNFIERIRQPDIAPSTHQEEESSKKRGSDSHSVNGNRAGSAPRSRAVSAGKSRPSVSSTTSTNTTSSKPAASQRPTTSNRPANTVLVTRPTAGSRQNQIKEEEERSKSGRNSNDPILLNHYNLQGDRNLPPPPLSTRVTSTNTRYQPPRTPSEDVYADDFEGADIDEPPPSYRNFASSHSHREEKESFPLKSSSSPHSSEGRNKGVHEEEESIPSYLNVIENKLQRKEKLSLIRQQTLDRVKQRQQQEEIKKKEKQLEEELFVQKIREEVKMKKLEEKANSTKQLAQQAELKRQLNRALEFHRKSLIIHYGFAPWIRFYERRRAQNEDAIKKYEDSLKRRHWKMLKEYYIVMKTERVRSDYKQLIKATILYKKNIIKKVFKAWKSYGVQLYARGRSVRAMLMKAVHLKRKSFHRWRIAFERSLRHTYYQMKAMESKGNRAVLRYYLRLWKEYHEKSQLDREIDIRAEQRWNMVQSWLRK